MAEPAEVMEAARAEAATAAARAVAVRVARARRWAGRWCDEGGDVKVVAVKVGARAVGGDGGGQRCSVEVRARAERRWWRRKGR